MRAEYIDKNITRNVFYAKNYSTILGVLFELIVRVEISARNVVYLRLLTLMFGKQKHCESLV